MNIFSELDPDQEDSIGSPASRSTNYRSRSVRIRLFVLVTLFMLVLVMMDEARKPRNWAWMGFDSPASQTEKSGEEIDTRLAPSERNPEATLIEETHVDSQDWLSEAGDEDLLMQELWETIYAELNADQRSFLFEMLRRGRIQKLSDSATQARWTDLTLVLRSLAENYLEGVGRTLQSLDPIHTDIDGWTLAVQEVRTQWNKETIPAIERLIDPGELTLQDYMVLQANQAILDSIAMSLVEDNRVNSPIREREFRYRLIDKLESLKAAELQQGQQVSFLELFKQPDAYRGQLVSVKGRVKAVRWQAAAENPYELDGYYVLWMIPTRGADSPIAVYCLNPPAALPLSADGNLEKSIEGLDELVDVTGYFVKKIAYHAQDGLRLAPMILTREARWESSSKPANDDSDIADSRWFGPIMLLAVFGGGMVAWYIYRMTKWQPRTLLRAQADGEQRIASRLRLIDDEEVLPSVHDRLGEISCEHQKADLHQGDGSA